MRQRKKLQELTINDNFMFGAVMMDEENCRRLLEISLGFPVAHVAVSKEKSIVYNPEYKGVRLDDTANDEAGTHFNVEMQAIEKPALGRRSRYYHSQIDMELLLSGRDYSKLSDAYVIFICDFDPFGNKKYRYTFDYRCAEVDELLLKDGGHTIFLSTRGINESEVPVPLVKFLKFVGANLKDSTKDYQDDYVRKLQNDVHEVKLSREMRERYMILQEMLREERTEGREEGREEGLAIGKRKMAETILDLLEDFGAVPETLKEKIINEKDIQVLGEYLKKATRAHSIEQFQKDIL